jgi:hypothetical protein
MTRDGLRETLSMDSSLRTSVHVFTSSFCPNVIDALIISWICAQTSPLREVTQSNSVQRLLVEIPSDRCSECSEFIAFFGCIFVPAFNWIDALCEWEYF